MIGFFSVHFIANLTTNPIDCSSQLSFNVYYVSIALKLTILEKKIEILDYVHHITDCRPGFENLTASLYLY